VKKLKYLVVFISMFFLINVTAFAKEEYSVIYNKELLDWDDNFVYDITVSSNDLSDNLELTIERLNYEKELIYVSNEYAIYSEYFYRYQLTDKTTEKSVTEIDGEAEVLVYMDGLVEGTKYDVYYFDNDEDEYELDENNIGDKAEVVEIDNKLYIRFVTSCLKSFALDMEESNEFKQEFNKISTDGYFLFPAVKPKKEKLTILELSSYFDAFLQTKRGYKISPLNEYLKENEYQFMLLEFDGIKDEKQIVKYKWKEENIPTNISNKLEEIEKIIIENTQPLDKLFSGYEGIYFEIEDLNYINFLANTDLNANEFNIFEKAVNYSSELKSIFNNNNFKYYFDFIMGNTEPVRNYACGYMLLGYNDLIYGLDFQTAYYIKPVIYIPSNTKDTSEDYIKEAKKRITKYLGVDDVNIEVGGTRESLTQDFNLTRMWEDFYNEENLSDYYYYITINGQKVEFVFEKNSEKIKEMKFKTKDLESDVEINTTSGRIPLDTLIEVDVIGKNHKEFKEILDRLKKDDGMIYDLSLYSETLSKYITKLDNGKFKVRVPLKDEYKNKKLKAYYITDEDEIEEYNISIEDGYAVFETDHFSTYTIAVEGDILPPKTFDGINLSLMLVLISFISLIGTGLYLKKRFN